MRLDRISEAAIVAIKGKWHASLSQIEVEMYFFSGLAFAYKAKPTDISNNWLADQPQVRQVVRRISNTFWFIREVLRYGPDCAVISPESMRKRLSEKLIALCQHYDLEVQTPQSDQGSNAPN